MICLLNRNKNIIAVFFKLSLIIFAISFHACSEIVQNSIIGDWQKSINDSTYVFSFQPNDKFILFLKTKNNTKTILSGYYELDFSKNPIPLSIRKIPQLETQLHTIISFSYDDKLIMAPFSSRWRLRPISFYGNNDIVLSKIQIDE